MYSRRIAVRLAAISWLVCLGGSSAAALTIATSANPADGWRAIAPVGNLEGQPIASVGLAWEAAHPGWNDSLTFDDSNAAGWHAPVVRDVTRYGATDEQQHLGRRPAE
jgi:hypothetical protein